MSSVTPTKSSSFMANPDDDVSSRRRGAALGTNHNDGRRLEANGVGGRAASRSGLLPGGLEIALSNSPLTAYRLTPLKTIIEPFRIKSVEPLTYTTPVQREILLQQDGYNV